MATSFEFIGGRMIAIIPIVLFYLIFGLLLGSAQAQGLPETFVQLFDAPLSPNGRTPIQVTVTYSGASSEKRIYYYEADSYTLHAFSAGGNRIAPFPVNFSHLVQYGWQYRHGLNGVRVLSSDFNRDGSPEILIKLSGNLDSKLLLLDEHGSIFPGWPLNGVAAPQDYYFSGDPMIVTHGNEKQIVTLVEPYLPSQSRPEYIYRFDQRGNRTLARTVSPPGMSSYLAVNSMMAGGDLNRDGYDEIVYEFDSYPGTQGLQLMVVDGSTGQSFGGFPMRLRGGSNYISHPTLVDLNADGYLDIVVNEYDNSSGVVRAVDARTRRDISGWPVNLGGSLGNNPVAGDMTGDGRPDVVVSGNPQAINQDTSWAIDSSGAILSGWPIFHAFAVQLGTHSPRIIDVDGDGRSEAFFSSANSIMDQATQETFRQWRVDRYDYRASHLRYFDALLPQLPQPSQPDEWDVAWSPVFADLRRDGDLEMIIAAQGQLYFPRRELRHLVASISLPSIAAQRTSQIWWTDNANNENTRSLPPAELTPTPTPTPTPTATSTSTPTATATPTPTLEITIMATPQPTVPWPPPPPPPPLRG